MEGKTRTTSRWVVIQKDFAANKFIYLMLSPVIVYYILFHYLPMYGVLSAFEDFSIVKGITGSKWIGLRNFEMFFNSIYFLRILRNTLLLSFYDILFGFPAPIILALLLNEIRSSKFQRIVQTVTYLPHFISTVIVCGILTDFLSRDGLINNLIALFGGHRIIFLILPEWFRTIYVSSNIWQAVGWGSIIYLAALTSIDPGLYEAAKMDGAGRWKQMWNITLPGIFPTITIMFILRMGSIMSVGFEKILLLYNSNTYVTADVIDTFVYRRGIMNAEYGFSAAVGLFNSLVALFLVVMVNWISRRVSEHSLW